MQMDIGPASTRAQLAHALIRREGSAVAAGPPSASASHQGHPHCPPAGRATVVCPLSLGVNSPGDGPNQGSSGGICRGGTEKFSIGEDNSITVSLPPHHLTILSLVIAENNQSKFIGKVSGGSNFKECSRRREIADHAPQSRRHDRTRSSRRQTFVVVRRASVRSLICLAVELRNPPYATNAWVDVSADTKQRFPAVPIYGYGV